MSGLAELGERLLRWRLNNPGVVARVNGKAISKADAVARLEKAAAMLTSDSATVDYDAVEECLHRALRFMVWALENEGNASGRPRRRRKSDKAWQDKLYRLSLEQPQVGPYELARKVTGRPRGDPLVVRLARAESKRRR
jgi:hypothetical protein